jgi:hypothetical protein
VNWLTIHQLGEAHHPPLQVRLTLPDGRQVSREPDIVTGAYRVAYAGSTGVYHSRELTGFWLRVEWIWRQQPLLDILREWGILPQGV